MLPLSCVDCCHNALQFDTLGLPVGYCAEHNVLLRFSHELTCGRHLRRDLSIRRALEEQEGHSHRLTPAFVAVVREEGKPANGGYTATSESDLEVLRDDRIAEVVTDYGWLDSEIGSLAQLRQIPGFRAEAAMLSLGRAYVQRCNARTPGRWTSGLHLLWWTRRRLADEPEVRTEDLRIELPLQVSRQIDIAKWSLLMLRLIFISDVGYHALGASGPGAQVGSLSELAEEAAAETDSISLRKLRSWIRRNALPRVDRALPRATYVQLSRELHEEQACG